MSNAIRPTHPKDREAILEVVRAAFSSKDRNGDEEVGIVNRTWTLADTAKGFELVAIEGDRIVGHVLAAQGDLAGEPAIGIAPLCVAPTHQRSGIGIALMNEVITRIEQAGWPFALLLGNPAYYRRLGFESAANHHINYPPAGASPAFQILTLKSYKPTFEGQFTYCFELT